jgi:hypothetical protein
VRNLKTTADGQVTRILREDLKDRKLFPDWHAVYVEPAHFSVWLTESECKALIPQNPKIGDLVPIPDAVQKRLIRYHLVNGVFRLPGSWRLEEIRSSKLTLTVTKTSSTWELGLEGSALLSGDADLAKAKRGYDVQLLGKLEIDPMKRTFRRFDVVALGDYWGGDYEGHRFARPGRTPLGISFELVRGHSAVDRVPPLVHMDRKEVHERYFAAERK